MGGRGHPGGRVPPVRGAEVSGHREPVATWGTEAMQPILDEYYLMYEAVKTSTPEKLIDHVTAGGFGLRMPDPTRR